MKTSNVLRILGICFSALTCTLLISCAGGSTPITKWVCKTASECLAIESYVDAKKCPSQRYPFNNNVGWRLKDIDLATPGKEEIYAKLRQTRIDHSVTPPAETQAPFYRVVTRDEPIDLGCKYYNVPDIEHVVQFSYAEDESCFTKECKGGPLPPGKANPPRDPRTESSCIAACASGVGGSCLGIQAASRSPGDIMLSNTLVQFRKSVNFDPLPTSVDLTGLFSVAGAPTTCAHTAARIATNGSLSSFEADACTATFKLAKNSLNVEDISITIPSEFRGAVVRNSSEGTIVFSDKLAAPLLEYRYDTNPGNTAAEPVAKLYFRDRVSSSGYAGVIAEGEIGYCFFIEYQAPSASQMKTQPSR